MHDKRAHLPPGGTTVSVIICAHADDRSALLDQALDSVKLQTQPPAEIIAVIDHNERLQARLARMHPNVRTIPNRYGRGLSGARNTGIEAATGEIIAFLDDDATASPDWIARLRAHYLDETVVGVGGRVSPVWPRGRPSWLPEEFDWVIGCSYRGLPEETHEVRNLVGCNMSFRRHVFERIGRFSEQLGRSGADGAGCEETELCIRLKQHYPDGRILYDPDIAVSHHISDARTKWGYFCARCLAEGRSKAEMMQATGTRSGLSSERSYARRVLPTGILRGLWDAMHGDRSGLSRAGTIIAGLSLVARSYVLARARRRRARTLPATSFAPIRILDLDLDSPLPALEPAAAASGVPYGAAFCLVRESGRPARIVEFPLPHARMAPDQLRELLAPAGVPVGGNAARPSVAQDLPFVRVVVATHDRPDSLSTCLDSLLQQDYPRFEIVVVDNAPSSPETAEVVRSRYAGAGLVHYVREDQAGLGRAHNTGAADAEAPIIAFTDDDVRVDAQWLRALASNFVDAERVGCVTGLILPAELQTRAQFWTERHGGFGKGFERRVFDMRDPPRHDRLFPFTAGAFGSGANMAFRTSALRRIDGFDAALGAGTIARGGDDLAAFYRVLRAGYQLVYEPQAIVWHHHRRSEAGMQRQAYSYGMGLGAYLASILLEDPRALLRFAAAFPWAVAHILGPDSSKNSRLPEDYPSSLKWRERLGILAGVPAYFRSRAAVQRQGEQAVPQEAAIPQPGK